MYKTIVTPLLQKHGYTFVLCLLFCLATTATALAQNGKSNMHYTVSMDDPASQTFQVQLHYKKAKADSVDFKMPAWTPGYYQLLNYADNVDNFSASGKDGKTLKWKKVNANTWRVYKNRKSEIALRYDVKAPTPFVAKNYLDTTRAYISPAGMFMHVAGILNQPVTVTIAPYKNWKDVATGLDIVPGKPYQFFASDFDQLYDSPILVSNLERLPEFTVNGLPHQFIGYQLGDFDRQQFMADIKKIVESASSLIGDIPYRHYTFIAIGPGRGGIEHLNSTTISFEGSEYNNPQGRKRLLSFIAHEYYHHYNAKRIRPIELGPFDYDKENRTNMLWVAEGATSYYENLVLRQAGLITPEDVLDALRKHMMAYENKSGRLFQSATQASYNTWSDGPFGSTTDEFNKTISVYDKGPVLNMLLDFKIRHESGNQKSLDDVMRYLYQEYYQKKGRGYTEAEYWEASEKMAGTPLTELKEYTATTKPINYPKYFAYAGLAIDTTATEQPGAYLGITTRMQDDTLVVADIDWKSPAWNAGLRKSDKLLKINGSKADAETYKKLMNMAKPGDLVNLQVAGKGPELELKATIGKQKLKNFETKPLANPTALQQQILKSWLRE
ncbi:M61 family metallopeptidase [Pontibacter fetidus]|uniref:M61 family metallopeptidase n=1 Tax=Pontibacter fetidus TaxID=2700082 RepID=A0A6B2H700_9BACT|nr:PDZ domain-containing protein [Pontibacter fetidus]NDK55680.1 M61 family metallopeptidase [Pontibacter fetidus]